LARRRAPLRGYNALIGLFELNRSNTQFALQADILKDAVQLVSDDPRTLMVAVAYAQLGQALFRAEELDAAKAAYGRAEALVAESSPGRERDALGAEVELAIARIELDKNLVQQSERRLQSIRGSLLQMADSPLQIDFLETSGTALLRLNRLDESARDLDLAVALADRQLRRIASKDDRWKSSRQYEDLFRTTAQMKLRTSPAAALTAWESLKAESLLTSAGDRDRLLPANPRAMLLIYMALPDGLAVWGWDGFNLREQWIAADMNALASLSARFLEECSDPESDLPTLRSDAASLYLQVVAPVHSWLQGQHAVVIEPDGPLKRIPLALLIDDHGTYLGDRLDIAISPGLVYLRGARSSKPLSAESSAFILANPQVPGWPPLPAASEEAHTVASIFDSPRLIEGAPLETAEMAQLAAGADLFHFAGHGFVDVDRAGIVAGPSSASSASEFDSLAHGRTSLVVLSACSTSSGTDGLYDGESSMVRTLLAAHVRDVVASRWNVDSSSTSLLMQLFYTELLRNKPVPEALSSAMRGVRAVAQYKHPYYWAAFSVFGNA
jgi:CHAT domain-containing protein